MIKNVLSTEIDKIQSVNDKKTRDYIGASIIGSDCWRQIWYEFKGYPAEQVPTKIRRTWAIGKHLEGLVISWLIDAGIQIASSWYDLECKELTSFKGHVDCVWIKDSLPFAIIEIKTAKDSSFNLFIKKGLKLWNPQYYAQVQSYMGMSDIHHACVLVLNKDNSEISDEWVVFDNEFYETLKQRAQIISSSVTPPPKISDSPIWYQCKNCKFNKICHN